MKFLRTVQLPTKRARKRTPTLISIFSGIGGAALGFRMAGFEVRVFVENDRLACATLARNWLVRPIRECRQRRPPAILCADITRLSVQQILDAAELQVGEADCLEGGFPCQGFSTANSRRHVGDERNRLYRQCVRMIRGTLPRHFFLENVPGLVSMERGAVMRTICDDLAGCGYDVVWDIKDAADYGVPQHRRRMLILGTRVDLLAFDWETGQPRLVIGIGRGSVQHPIWFERKYPGERP